MLERRLQRTFWTGDWAVAPAGSAHSRRSAFSSHGRGNLGAPLRRAARGGRVVHLELHAGHCRPALAHAERTSAPRAPEAAELGVVSPRQHLRALEERRRAQRAGSRRTNLGVGRVAPRELLQLPDRVRGALADLRLLLLPQPGDKAQDAFKPLPPELVLRREVRAAQERVQVGSEPAGNLRWG